MKDDFQKRRSFSFRYKQQIENVSVTKLTASQGSDGEANYALSKFKSIDSHIFA